jgi:hypothetical protein
LGNVISPVCPGTRVPVSADESQIKEVSIDLFEHFDFSPEKF